MEPAASEESKGQHRMGRSSHAQVHLERRNVPGLAGSAPRRQEVDRESADPTSCGEAAADAEPQVLDGGAILICRRKETAEVDLAAGAAEDLLVCRAENHIAPRIDAKLNARRTDLRGFDHLLDDSTAPRELREVRSRRFAVHRKPQMLKRFANR